MIRLSIEFFNVIRFVIVFPMEIFCLFVCLLKVQFKNIELVYHHSIGIILIMIVLFYLVAKNISIMLFHRDQQL